MFYLHSTSYVVYVSFPIVCLCYLKTKSLLIPGRPGIILLC